MSKDNPVFINGNHYQFTSSHGEKTIVYFYYNPDAKCNGFGFNIADGGDFLPMSDLTNKTIVNELKITVE